MRYQGRITSWKDDKGYGFVVQNGTSEQVFIHIKSFSDRQRRPVGDEIVTYEIATDAQGRKRAENVEFVSNPPSKASATKGGSFPMKKLIVIGTSA
jgi:cold shock CspA family protein